ncbi:MAG: hypothetical protein AAFU85_21420, partial [Planctomycetota bacterium]
MAEREDDFDVALDNEPGSNRRATAEMTVALGPDDFQRIGLQPLETRLTVIRRAATRTSKSLASRQLSEPSLVTEHQLSRVALSTYRVLDPRQRVDAKQRAHVGRIRPGTLLMAEQAAFADGRILTLSSCCEDDLGLPAGSLDPDGSNATASRAEALEHNSGAIAGLRSHLRRPQWIVAMIVTLLCAAVASGCAIQRWHPNCVPKPRHGKRLRSNRRGPMI